MNDTDIAMEDRIWAGVVARLRETPEGFGLKWFICPACFKPVAQSGPARSAPSGRQLWHERCFNETGRPLWEAEAKRWGY